MLKRFLAALFVLLPVSAYAQGTVMPSPVFTALDSNGDPLSSSKLCSYIAGSTTPATTYSNAELTVANTNPVIMTSAGRPNNGTGAIWLSPGVGYKFILRSAGSDGTCSTGTVQWSVDGVSGVPATSGNLDALGTAGETITAGQAVYLSDGSGAKTAGQWFLADADLTYASTLPLVGVAPSAIASGASGTIRLAGQVTGLTSLTVGSAYYISSTAGGLTSTAPANRRVVGIADSTSSLVLALSLPTLTTTSTITTTGTQIALPIPSGSGPLAIFANNATLLTVQGIAAGIDGQELDLFSIGGGQVDLDNQSGSATGANRIINGVTGRISLAANAGRVRLQYDGTTARWRVVLHEQGAWITPAFSAGDFTGSTQPWTVGGGDVTTSSYYLRGRLLTYRFYLGATTVTAGATALNIASGQWGGFTAAGTTLNPFVYNDNAGGNTVGFAQVSPAGPVQLFKLTGTFGAATDATSAFGEIAFEVQ